MLHSDLAMRTRVYTKATDKEDRFWERLIELKLSNVETPAHKRSHLTVQGNTAVTIRTACNQLRLLCELYPRSLLESLRY